MFAGSGLVSVLGVEKARKAVKRQARGKAPSTPHNARSRSTSKDTTKGQNVAGAQSYATDFPSMAENRALPAIGGTVQGLDR